MQTYQRLSEAMVDAIQHARLDEFIGQLNQGLAHNPADYLAWLFVARAHEAKGSIDLAANSYTHLLRLAKPNNPNTPRLLDEVKAFAARRKRGDLLKIAQELAPNQLTEATLETPRTHEVPVKQKPAVQPLQTKPAPLSRESEGADVSKRAEPAATILRRANVAFQKGDLETALEGFNRAYRMGDRHTRTLLMVAQTLQRLGRHTDALIFLDREITELGGSAKLSLLNLKAQILSRLQDWANAATTYEQLVQLEPRSPAKQFHQIQLARLYRLLGDTEKAMATVNRVLADSPQDQVALRIKLSLDRVEQGGLPGIAVSEEEARHELEVDISDEDMDIVSPMLRRDVAEAEFRDERILRQGGQAEPEDADRLLKDAEGTAGSEFWERYPLFLEAAKAYSELPEGSYDLERFYQALTRYAMLKGGALVSEFRRNTLSGTRDVSKLRYLRDSATSYYLESLVLQARFQPNFAIISLTNHLRTQVACALAARGDQVPSDLFEWEFAELFRFCLVHKDDDVTRTAYECVIAWGAASANVWNRLAQRGGIGILWGTLQRVPNRSRPYRILSAISGQSFDVSKKPKEVLQMAFLKRREHSREVLSFFSSLRNVPLAVQNLQGPRARWEDFPLRGGALLDTDAEIHREVSAILTTLLPYQTRSVEERTAILFATRTRIENLLRSIQQNPTYWGRVGFEPLLEAWQASLRGIEQRRLEEIQPQLTAYLEPPVFYLEDGWILGGLSMQNCGSGTAEGAVLAIELKRQDCEEILYRHDERMHEEIAVEGTYHHPLRFPASHLCDGVDAPYRLQIGIAPMFREAVLDIKHQEFTLELQSPARFTVGDIPWNEIQIPPEHLFKGRREFLDCMVGHLKSPERNKTYILYGLTRTGKSSILRYLGKQLELQPLNVCGDVFRLISFEWHMDRAKANTNARDMWGYLLKEALVDRLEQMAEYGVLQPEDVPQARSPDNMRFRDWELLLRHLLQRRLYPVFLLDEFSYYRELIDSKRLDASFLASIRSLAIEGKASFVFAGTYDLRRLIKDPSYGITGQFINAIETRVSRIDREPAIELIQVMEPRLRFTRQAIEHILWLSYQIPYFIQILCKNCAIYAAHTGRSVIGFPELETVTQALAGEFHDPTVVGVGQMAPGVFMNNMHTPSDPVEYEALLSTLGEFARTQIQPRPVLYSSIQETWHRHGVPMFRARLAQAIRELVAREVLTEGEDEGMPTYRISVDLFRRWWANEHRYLNMELDAVKQEA